MVTNISTGFLPCSLSQASTPDSDRPPPILRNQASLQHHLTAGSSIVTRGLATSGLPSKKKKKKLRQPRDSFLFWRQREDGKGRKNQERKINLQSSGTSQISVTLHRWFHAPIPKCTGLSVCQGCLGLSEEQQLGLCPPQVTELQFEVAAMGLSSSRSMLELVGCRLL